MSRFRRRPRFGRAPKAQKPAVKVVQMIRTGRPGPCMGCGQRINLGDDYVQVRLAKWASGPCSTCNQTPKRMRRYHLHCKPADVEKAMGFDPTKHQHAPATPDPWSVKPPVAPAAPPPKPKTSTELKVEGINVLEAALVAGLRERSVTRTPELNKAFETLANIKARIKGGSTPGETEAATNVGLKKIIDIVFSAR